MIEHGTLIATLLACQGAMFIMLRALIISMFKVEIRKQDDRLQKRSERPANPVEVAADLNLHLGQAAYDLGPGEPMPPRRW